MFEHISKSISSSGDKVSNSISGVGNDILKSGIESSKITASATMSAGEKIGGAIDVFAQEYKYAHSDNFSVFSDSPELLLKLVELSEDVILKYYDNITLMKEKVVGRVKYSELNQLKLLSSDDLIKKIQDEVKMCSDVKQRALFLIKCNKFLRDMTKEIILDLMSMSNLVLTIHQLPNQKIGLIPTNLNELYLSLSNRYANHSELMSVTRLFAPFVINVINCLKSPVLTIKDASLKIDNILNLSLLQHVFHPLCFDISLEDDDAKHYHFYENVVYNGYDFITSQLKVVLWKYVSSLPIPLPGHRSPSQMATIPLNNFVITRLIESLVEKKCNINCTFNYLYLMNSPSQATCNESRGILDISFKDGKVKLDNLDKLLTFSDESIYDYVFSWFWRDFV